MIRAETRLGNRCVILRQVSAQFLNKVIKDRLAGLAVLPFKVQQINSFGTDSCRFNKRRATTKKEMVLYLPGTASPALTVHKIEEVLCRDSPGK